VDYQWVKALHLISVMSWMAGLLYLPRLFVYHSQVENNGAQALTFALMERRLLKAIMNPAMILSYGFGIWMIVMNPILLEMPWMWVKLGAIAIMTYAHMLFGKMRKELESGHARPTKQYRYWNEVPTVMMIVIIIMAVVEPF